MRKKNKKKLSLLFCDLDNDSSITLRLSLRRFKKLLPL